MQVLHISNFRFRGGGTTVARQLAQDSSVNSTLLFLEAERTRLGPEGAPVPEYACHWTDFSYVSEVARKLIERDPVLIVHCHGRRSGVHGRVLRATLGRNVRMLLSFHGIASYIVPRRWIVAWQEVVLSPWTDFFVAAGIGEAALFRHLPLACPLRIIPNCYDTDAIVEWSPRPVRTIGFCARFEPPKLHAELIRLVAAYNERSDEPLNLVFSGDGSKRAEVDALGRQLLGDRYRSLGHIPDIRDFYRQIDAFILFSRHEGMPISLIDAMRSGIPCVATDVRGCRDVIENDVTGLLVPVGDTDAGVAALQRLAETPDLAAKLARAGGERAKAVHSPEVFRRSYRAIYDELANELEQPAPDAVLNRSGGN